MRITFLFILFLAAAATLSSGCGGSTPTNNTANANAATVNSAANANSPIATTKKPEAETTNDAPTITPVVRAYYEALKKKDDAAIRKLLAADFLRSVEADMKEEKKSNMAAYMAEYDTIPEKPIEVRNERIEGDKAVAEIRGGAYKTWTSFSFIKENGSWKFTGGSADIDSVEKR